MVFQVPAAVELGEDEVFPFTLPGSRKKFSIPLAKYLAPRFVLALATMPDVRATHMILEEYAPGAFELFKSNPQLEAFGEAWREASGLGLGESSASSNS